MNIYFKNALKINILPCAAGVSIKDSIRSIVFPETQLNLITLINNLYFYVFISAFETI